MIAAKAVSFKVAAGAGVRRPAAPHGRRRRDPGGAAVASRTSQAAGIAVLTGGTDVHLVLVDLRDSELDGKVAEDRLHAIGVTVNRNAVPFDPRPPMVTSGLRIGTPALATRGFDEAAFAEVADIVATALLPSYDDEVEPSLRGPGDGARRGLPALPRPDLSRAPAGPGRRRAVGPGGATVGVTAEVPGDPWDHEALRSPIWPSRRTLSRKKFRLFQPLAPGSRSRDATREATCKKTRVSFRVSA